MEYTAGWKKLCANLGMGWEQLGRRWDGKQSGREQDALRRDDRRRGQKTTTERVGKSRSGTWFTVSVPSRSRPDHFFPSRLLPRVSLPLTCTWVRRGLDGPTCSESLPEGTCHFEPPEHVPRTSVRAKLAPWCPGGLPACHRAESTRKDPRPEEPKMPKCQKNAFIHINILGTWNGAMI